MDKSSYDDERGRPPPSVPKYEFNSDKVERQRYEVELMKKKLERKII